MIELATALTLASLGIIVLIQYLVTRQIRKYLDILETRLQFLETHLGITYSNHSNPTTHEWHPGPRGDIVEKQ